MMKQLLLVFFGGGLGSVLRFIISKYLNNPTSGIPYGTFLVNIFGLWNNICYVYFKSVGMSA